jgi:cytosine/adenosine deaminase-related metal-dependent hydrolase
MHLMAPRRERPWTLTARWIFPVDVPPLERGVVTISEGRILAVESCADRRADYDLGDVAILPGLVNAHTHLDLGSLDNVPSTKNFIDWLKAVIQHRRSLRSDQVLRNIRAGLKQSSAYGTTLLGDISSQGQTWEVLAGETRCRAVVFHELLGLPRPRAHQAWAAACAWLRAHPDEEACRPGLSPHAPYSVRASVFRAAARLSRRQRLSVAIHLAETREELELLEHHTGSFVPFLSELGVWDAGGLVKGVDDLLQLDEEAARILFVHGNYLDCGLALPRGATVVYCPRTHAAFGHAPHPFRDLLANGVRVALGTDSLASNPDLDVLAEARHLHQLYPDVPGATILRMATLSGAEALGWHEATGSLTPGKSADLVVLPLPSENYSDPHELILSSLASVQAVLFRGRWVYQCEGCRLPANSEREERGKFDGPGSHDTGTGGLAEP